MAQGRRVRRVVRKIDTWSLAKMAFLFNLCLALVFVVAGTLLWMAADGQGLIDKLEKTVKTNLQLDTFAIDASVLFRAAVASAVLFALFGTFLWILGAFLFNLLSDLVGGVQVWVLEEVLFDQAQEEEDAIVTERAEPAGLEPVATPSQVQQPPPAHEVVLGPGVEPPPAPTEPPNGTLEEAGRQPEPVATL